MTPMSQKRRLRKKREEEDQPEGEFVEDMDTAVALTAMAECDDEEADVTEELGDAAQYQLMAFVAVDQMKGKGKNKGKVFGKKGGKGQGKQQRKECVHS